MSSKEVYEEYNCTEGYETEVDKSLALGCIYHAVMFYHLYQYCKLTNQSFISEKKFAEICDFIVDNIHNSSKNNQEYIVFEDVAKYECNLTLVEKEKDFIKGKHVLASIDYFLQKLRDRLNIDFRLEIVEE